MILVVDDDEAVVAVLVRALRRGGLDAQGFTDPERALEWGLATMPDLIVSDIVMPGLDGYAFKAAWRARFPGDHPPFVFLSGLADPEHVVRGLEDGADDYLTKPIQTPVFVAKVKATLRRQRARAETAYRGDLAQLSVAEVIQFCERWGLTGELEISDGQEAICLPFQAGCPFIDEQGPLWDALCDFMTLEQGSFLIRSRPLAFDELTKAPVPRAPSIPPTAPPGAVVGRLSGVNVAGRLMHLQTEFDASGHEVITVVTFQGEVLDRRATPVAPEAGNATIGAVIDDQHGRAEAGAPALAEALAPADDAPPAADSASRDETLRLAQQLIRDEDLEGALEVLEQGLQRYPDDRLLQAHRATLRRRDDPGTEDR